MERGNLNNVTAPFLAFDFNTVLFVPIKHTFKVKILEMFMPLKAVRYYRAAPGAKHTMMQLMNVMYNIMIVNIGPRRLWKQKMYLLNYYGIPFSRLNCIENQQDFNETIVKPSEVLQYHSLSEFATHNAGAKGRLFQSWESFLQAQIRVPQDIGNKS